MPYVVEKRTLEPHPILFIRRRVPMTALGSTLAEILPATFAHCQKEGIPIVDRPFCRYAEWGPGVVTIEAGCVLGARAEGRGEIVAGMLPGGPVIVTTHVGSYDRLSDAHAALEEWMTRENVRRRGAGWESYVTDPGTVPDPSQWRTDVFAPIEA